MWKKVNETMKSAERIHNYHMDHGCAIIAGNFKDILIPGNDLIERSERKAKELLSWNLI